ncbi:MAG: radical SAM protein [Myxococcota bacterium]
MAPPDPAAAVPRPAQVPTRTSRATVYVASLRTEADPALYEAPIGVYDRDRRNLELNIGRACNNHCVFCVSGKAVKDERMWVPPDKAKHEVKVAFDRGCRSLGFLGGEPSIYPHLVEVTQYARELGYTRVALATNAMVFDNAEYARKVVEAGVTRATISFHAHTRKLEHVITKVPNAFDRKVKAIENLLALKREGRLPDNVSVNPVINSINFRHLPGMVRFFARLGLDDVRFNFIRNHGNAEDDGSLCPTFTDLRPYLERIVEENEAKHRITVTFGELPYCAMPWALHTNRELFRRYVGELHDYITDVAIFASPRQPDDGLYRFNWQDSKRNDLKMKVDACQTCRYLEPCEGVWRTYVDLHGDREIRPVR